MTTEQHPGGVAGKLIDEIRVHYQAAETSSEAQSYGNQIAGLVVLHDELSREARQHFDELRLATLPDDPDLPREDQIHATGFVAGFRYLCEHLGLDLESEDE